MLRSGLYDYDDAYTLLNGTITITGARNDDAVRRLDEWKKERIFKNCAPFTDCISKRYNIQMDNAKCIDVVFLMYN